MVYPLFLGSLGFWEILLIVLVFLLLFGGKKIPELMHGLGKGMKSFRKGMNEVEDEIKEATKEFDSITKETEEKK
ncbi:MAG: twin-arginine translocase TatA/TatE family subunit [Bacteroidales bacterium]|nr:twin-arginine translocase TatA/TatE family subunit [Bacteroidales bacterium]